MPTSKAKKYKRGAEKERKIVRIAKSEGCIAFRSAGSHSPIDVCIIDFTNRKIKLIQCKHSLKLRGKIEPKLKEKLESEFRFLNGTYEVIYKAI